MSLTETVNFDKEGQVVHFSPIKRLFIAIILVLISTLSFGLGRLSTVESSSNIQVEYDKNIEQTQNLNLSINKINKTTEPASAIISVSAGGVYASGKGKKYYYPWCKSAVSESNKVTFNSAQIAESAGYTLATNCKPK